MLIVLNVQKLICILQQLFVWHMIYYVFRFFQGHEKLLQNIVSLIVKMFNVFALSNSTYRLIEGFKQQ